MKLLAIDANSILNRAYYGIKALTTKNGEYTNGIYGFLNILQKLLEQTAPDAVACAFDLRAPTFRHKLYEDYKGKRKGMPDDLASQLEPLKEILGALGYKVVSQEGYEADDILGTLSRACASRGAECVIATGDRDSLQLVDEHTSVLLATTKMSQPLSTMYKPADIEEKYGVKAPELVEVKALMGDASDNIPGVAGVGEKTALSLISQYHSIDTIYEQLETLALAPALRKKLEAGRDSAYMSRTLGRIECAAPIDTDIASYQIAPRDEAAAAALFARLEMFALAKKWGIDLSKAAAQSTGGTRESVPAAPLRVMDYGMIPQQKEGDLLVCWKDGIPFCAFVAADKLYIGGRALLAHLQASFGEVRVWSGKPVYKEAFYDGRKIPLARFDGELAAYLLSPSASSYEITELSAQYGALPRQLLSPDGGEMEAGTLAVRMQHDAPCEEDAQTLLKPDNTALWETLIEQARLFGGLMDVLETQIKDQQQEKLLQEIEIPLARVLASMECDGFTLDAPALRAYGAELKDKIEKLEQSIYGLAGHQFNINSTRQLGELLFEQLALPAKKKTKTGYSTNADVLNALRGQHPVIEDILEYRKLTKLQSTYVDGLLKVVGADGRVRTTFQQTETRTGRISSIEPNLQNIPVRTPEGAVLRRFFVPRAGWRLLDADYSQIELRVLADLAQDPVMIEAFNKGTDIHTVTAAQVFGMPEDMVTPQMRSRAKAVNFGIVYGIGAFSLAQDIGVSVKEADTYIKGYLDTYAGVRKYMEDTIEQAKQDGYVTTLFGRRRYLPELAASNKVTRAFGERVARNTPIQGTAADVIKIAMVRVYERLEKEGLRARLILQVHDELLVEAPPEEVAAASKVLHEEMENAIALKVPLAADTHEGENWLEAK